MRRTLLATFLLLLALAGPAGANPAQITAEKRLGPRWIELTISTPAFVGPTHVDIDLPGGYDADPTRRWPVTYVLAGTQNTYRSFNSFVGGLKLTESYPSIIVSPNGDSGYWSDWYNGGAFGPPIYETYVLDQLIPLIDQHYRTIAKRSQRAVLGVSMGGYGSMMFAAHRPDLFAAASSISGAVDSNLPAHSLVLSASPELQGEDFDAIYGPRATQEVRWHGHNPTDLADNLRDLDLQVRTANGIPNPGIGENPTSADTVSCVVEGGVHMASVSFHDTLDQLHIPHLWQDYGPGCHTKANFTRELTDTFNVFEKVFANPPAAPATFNYMSIKPEFEVYGWHVAVDKKRALEFLQLDRVGRRGLTLTGSGTTTVTTPPIFKGRRSVALRGAKQTTVIPDRYGRITFSVDLGPADTDQQYTPGAQTTMTTRSVSFARAPLRSALAVARRARACAGPRCRAR